MTYSRCWNCLQPFTSEWRDTLTWPNGAQREVHPECVEAALLVRIHPGDRKVKEQ